MLVGLDTDSWIFLGCRVLGNLFGDILDWTSIFAIL